MKVLFAAAEFTPVARVGGLAEAAAGLVHALRDADVEVEVVLPDYGDVVLTDQVEGSLTVPPWVGGARFRRGTHRVAGDLTLVGVPGIERPHPYVDEHGVGWHDNAHRFMAFAAAVAALAAATGPDVVHLNDWHTAAATGMMPDRPPTVLTIHTLGYQGTTDRSWLERLPVEAHRFAWWDGTNPLAGAIELVDRVIAVSPNYAAEIVTRDGGMGLDDRLFALGDRLVGIRNGIDTAIWNPENDPHLAAQYSVSDRSGRDACRQELASITGWPLDSVPIIAMVSRLVDQKGIDLLLDAARFLPLMSARLAVLGAGATELAEGLRSLSHQLPEHAWFHEGYDEPLAHRLFAGSDLFVMPSRFEPCGLAQMQAMAYGSMPVVTDVGGLHDTVIDADRDRRHGTGFTSSVDAVGLVDALHRGVRASRHSGRHKAIQGRGMRIDWSWTDPAAQHIAVYESIIAERVGC